MHKEKQIKAFRDEVLSLKCERESAREEARKSKELYKQLRRRTEDLEKIVKDQGKSDYGRAVQNPFDIISSLPLCLKRPAHGTLVPIAKKGVQLREYLLSRTDTQAYANTVLFLPGRFSWCTTARTYHHALAFGPTHTFNIQSRQWEKGTFMEPLYGQTREFFYEDKGDVFYSGTYRCIRLDNPIINWPEPGVQGLVPYIMAETALSEDFRNAPCSHAHKGTVSKLYREGVLKLECMGLQCVGFDKELYKHLVAQYQHNSPTKEKKRSASVEEDKARKRKKT
ncbi:hypothetical protein P691DRAFT_350677 [Macrolepiota fuliginosa MF-IS2]|uniref:DUF6697 domain-containing protein n=1 Tax=Macrolepiota fuliginosa MF-IS2 TaxID=1400762 RepID=A0A9P5X6J7_9AGAR|nr:hypothetical protein P691DRAFT_350677 [Macrolepiota fuliginosa MF-IS2]